MSSSFKSPVDTAKAISATAGAKNSANIVNVILLSFLAGAYIAFGGLLAIIASAGMAGAGAPAGLEKFVFGAVFPVGLIIVVLAGSELFTGNVMFMTIGVLDGSASVGGLAKNWVLAGYSTLSVHYSLLLYSLTWEVFSLQIQYSQQKLLV